MPKDRQTDKYGKLEGTFLVSKDLLEKFLKQEAGEINFH